MIGTIIARKAVAKAFKALSNHDLAGFMSAWRDDGILTYPGEIKVTLLREVRCIEYAR